MIRGIRFDIPGRGDERIGSVAPGLLRQQLKRVMPLSVYDSLLLVADERPDADRNTLETAI